jgi:hypothetical protein|tara:strand:- start:678 stop:1433 length:756 start_codon:yes stop_codon:yes gene_type:complete
MTGFGTNVLGFGSGGSGGPVTLTTQTLVNGQENYNSVTTSNFISDGGTLIVPANFWVWGNAAFSGAMNVDTPNCIIENYGKIIGNAGYRAMYIGQAGVTVINHAGAYIAGGGGSGGSGNCGGGGQGAGDYATELNATGAAEGNANGGQGGGAGAGGSGYFTNASGYCGTGVARGGRILPGNGGAGGWVSGAGGSAGNAGGSSGNYVYGAGGGGGWGASGGRSANLGSAGASAIDAGLSYTLSNSGTIYGAS